MLQRANQTETRALEWSCEAVSQMAEPCDTAANVHCGICGRWFCTVHADDEAWRICVVDPDDEGGEG